MLPALDRVMGTHPPGSANDLVGVVGCEPVEHCLIHSNLVVEFGQLALLSSGVFE